MKEATRRAYIENDPASGVAHLHETPQQRGILVLDEIRAIFAPEALALRWNGMRPAFAAAFLAVSSGLRMGEVRALRVMDVHRDFVAVAGSWEDGHGRKHAKWDSDRIVPIPSRVADVLQEVIDESNRKDPEYFVFPNRTGSAPIHQHILQTSFYAALHSIGIDDPTRRRRRLCWHSMRHYFAFRTIAE